MKLIVFILLFLSSFVFVAGASGQTKTSNNDTIIKLRVASKLRSLEVEKALLSARKKRLLAEYNNEYPEIQQINDQIEKVVKEISELKSNPEKYQLTNILNESVPSDELLKIIILQNQKIIELLEKLTVKK